MTQAERVALRLREIQNGPGFPLFRAASTMGKWQRVAAADLIRGARERLREAEGREPSDDRVEAEAIAEGARRLGREDRL